GNRSILTCEFILYAVGFIIEEIGCTCQCVVRNIVEVTSESQPRSGHRNMVRRAFSFCFDQQFQAHPVLAIPGSEWTQSLKTLRFWIDLHLHLAAIFCGGDEARIFNVESLWWEFHALRLIETYRDSILIQQRIF